MIKRKYKLVFKVGGGITRTFRIKCAQADLQRHIRDCGEMLSVDFDDVTCVAADECDWPEVRDEA